MISTLGDASVPGIGGKSISVRGEDLLVFTPTSLGSTTKGTWTKYFDGSNVGLSGSSEKVDALAIEQVQANDAAMLLLSTSGSFSVAGASGQDEDVVSYDLAARLFRSRPAARRQYDRPGQQHRHRRDRSRPHRARRDRSATIADDRRATTF